MPRNRNQTGRGRREDDEHNNNNQHGHNPENNGAAIADVGAQFARCCVPRGCSLGNNEPIYPLDPHDAVRVTCNNENCTMGNWMHKVCFEDWEEHVLNYLRSCGRARSWSEKQRLQNLWTKKGYDLAFKACDCNCKRGHMRKDLDYWPKEKALDGAAPRLVVEPNKKKKHHKKNDKPMPVMNRGPPPHQAKPTVRVRNTSVSSTGSISPPSPKSPSPTNIPGLVRTSSISPQNTPVTNDNITAIEAVLIQNVVRTTRNKTTGSPVSIHGNSMTLVAPKPRFTSDASTGRIFERRTDFSVFNFLPKHKQNPYHIKMEDEGPHANDEARCLILSSLSSYKMSTIPCILCNRSLGVYDRYPLIDGTFFLSPVPYNINVQVVWEDKPEYVSAICMHCLEGECELRCRSCGIQWDGSTLVLGTVYSYDIFAAMPCCQQRLACKNCSRNILDLSLGGFQFYCEYTHNISCPFCKTDDFHFVKPLNQCFFKRQLISN